MLIAEDTRQRLLEAAGEVFAEKGFRAATVREICNKAEANIAAVNFYFRSKFQLYVEAVRHAYLSCRDRAPIPEWAPGTPATVRLRQFIRMLLERAVVDHTPEWHGRLIMRELSQPTEACAEFVREFVRPSFEVLRGILQELLPADVSPARLRLIGFSVVGQVLHYRFCRPVITLLVGADEFRNLSADLLADHISTFTLAALGHEKPASVAGKERP